MLNKGIIFCLIFLLLAGCSPVHEKLEPKQPEIRQDVAEKLLQKHPKNFQEAKKIAKQIFANNPYTFYCGCRYDQAGKVDLTSCNFKPKKETIRSHRIEWEHIMPAKQFGGHLQCWQEAVCVNKNGKHYKGRQCCEKINESFNLMESDLYNLVPAVGEINLARGSKEFAELGDTIAYEFGACKFKIDRAQQKVEPDPKLKGIIARTYLYMANQYDIEISDEQFTLFNKWDNQYPPTNWEKARNKKITDLQKNGFVANFHPI